MARMPANFLRGLYQRLRRSRQTKTALRLHPSDFRATLATAPRRPLMRMVLTPAAFLLAAFLSGPASLITSASASLRPQASLNPDALLATALQEIGAERFDKALEHIDALIQQRPNFRLAHLIKGDLLIARARPLSNIGSAVQAPPERVADLREEAVARLRAYRERPTEGKVPRYLMKLKPEQQYAIVVDTNRSRLYLYRNEGETPRYVADYYIS